ncbi:unnamed protein product [Adineta steineri]|uniref:G-protein coupled receptors family 1 profile domain-containing protein n=2 Tax=Adineta steineri TaxID=433720 RepID=A0A815U3T3_9BILA|nr:unnamed protein product [Adineta steineri]CAF4176641.1 unnamed protein product [Adineta steineri]
MCIFLTYFTSIATNAICYSYLVTAISQYFFNILYRRKYLLTFRMHWFIIFLSWFISFLLPLLLYLQGALRYSSETHMCFLDLSKQWAVLSYMIIAIGIPYFSIIFIYRNIIRHTRRINTMINATSNLQIMSNRDLRVLKNILILIGILGAAGFPSLILFIWNLVTPGKAPVPFYLACILVINICTNIQISFIFTMNKNMKIIFWNRVKSVFQ